MKPTKRFKITYYPDKLVNRIMRDLDFFSGGEGLYIEHVYVVTWKEGEVVDKARVSKTIENLRKAIEQSGGEVFSIEEIGSIACPHCGVIELPHRPNCYSILAGG